MKFIQKKELIPLLQKLLPNAPIIVEAGAFNGRDTITLAKTWPHGTVHAFEPVPDIFAVLEKNTADIPSVHRYSYALSADTGKALFYVSEKSSAPNVPFQAGSLQKPTGRLEWSPIRYPSTIYVDTITLDQWAQEHSVDHIDLLWLDVQGHGLSILQAAPVMLKKIAYLYLEIEFKEAYEKQPSYNEVLAWLAQNSFEPIARDFIDTSTWFYGNILFKNNMSIKQEKGVATVFKQKNMVNP